MGAVCDMRRVKPAVQPFVDEPVGMVAFLSSTGIARSRDRNTSPAWSCPAAAGNLHP
jgi:hypothetical protein